MNRGSPDLPAEIMWQGQFVTAYRKGSWEYVGRSRGITAVVILAEVDGCVLLVEQLRVPIGRACLELPAGLVGDEDQAATVEATAVKELEEETGFTASHVERLGDYYSSPGMVAEAFTLVRAHGVRPTGQPPEEGITVHQVPLAEIGGFIAGRRAAGSAIDVRLLLLLGAELLGRR